MQTSKVRFSASEIDHLCKIQHLRVLFQTVLSFQPLTTLKQSFTDIFLNRCSWKFRISHKKYLCWSLFLIKLQISFYSKETPTQFLSCEYCDIFKNSFFKEHLATASDYFGTKLYLRYLTEFWIRLCGREF